MSDGEHPTRELPPITGSLNAQEEGNDTAVITIATFNKPPDNHPIYALVGRVAAEWSELEHQLDGIIWRLSGTSSPQAACLTSQMIGHFPRFNAIIALLNFHNAQKTVIEAADKERGKVSQLAEKRARTVHDAWYIGPSYPDPLQFRARPRGDLTFGMSSSHS